MHWVIQLAGRSFDDCAEETAQCVRLPRAWTSADRLSLSI